MMQYYCCGYVSINDSLNFKQFFSENSIKLLDFRKEKIRNENTKYYKSKPINRNCFDFNIVSDLISRLKLHYNFRY